MIYGAHIATAGDFAGIPKRAQEMGADVVQIFAGSPRTWRQKVFTEEEGQVFKTAMKDSNRTASYIHMLYLTSYGSPNEELRRKSIDGYSQMLQTADTLGSVGVVTHLGSHKGEGFEARVQSLADGIVESVEAAGVRAYAILENSAGQGGVMGNSIEELGRIYELTGRHSQIKFCIDTAHLMGAGIEFRDQAGCDQMIKLLDQKLGLENIVLFHLNDSKVDLGERKDRHENIGDGFVGKAGFKALLGANEFKDTHSVLEVPGLEGGGPDKANIDRLIEIYNW